MDDTEHRLTSMEGRLSALENQLPLMNKVIDVQAQSLSIPLLKEILVPMTMRLFSFFSILVITLISAILGVKWMAQDLLK